MLIGPRQSVAFSSRDHQRFHWVLLIWCLGWRELDAQVTAWYLYSVVGVTCSDPCAWGLSSTSGSISTVNSFLMGPIWNRYLVDVSYSRSGEDHKKKTGNSQLWSEAAPMLKCWVDPSQMQGPWPLLLWGFWWVSLSLSSSLPKRHFWKNKQVTV